MFEKIMLAVYTMLLATFATMLFIAEYGANQSLFHVEH